MKNSRGLVARCFSYEKVRAANARRVAAESRRPTSVKERDGRLSPNSVHRPRRGLPAHRGQLRLKGDVAAAPTNWTGHDVDCFGDLCRRCRRPNAAKSSHLLYFPPAFHVLATTEARNCYVSLASTAPSTGCRISLAARCLIVLQKGRLSPSSCVSPFPSILSFRAGEGLGFVARGCAAFCNRFPSGVTCLRTSGSSRSPSSHHSACAGARHPGDRPRCSLVRIEARHGHVRASVGHHETAGACLFCCDKQSRGS